MTADARYAAAVLTTVTTPPRQLKNLTTFVNCFARARAHAHAIIINNKRTRRQSNPRQERNRRSHEKNELPTVLRCARNGRVQSKNPQKQSKLRLLSYNSVRPSGRLASQNRMLESRHTSTPLVLRPSSAATHASNKTNSLCEWSSLFQ